MTARKTESACSTAICRLKAQEVESYHIASFCLRFELTRQQVFHIHILFPHVADRLVCEGHGVHIGWWTKFRRDIQIFFLFHFMLIDDLLPQV